MTNELELNNIVLHRVNIISRFVSNWLGYTMFCSQTDIRVYTYRYLT